MGWGDEIIASGQARKLHEQVHRRVLIVDRDGKPRWHDAWLHNPRILCRTTRSPGQPLIKNGPGARPYIKEKSDRKWTWNEFECPVGELHFSKDELDFAAAFDSFVVVEPNNKSRASPNKQWGLERWQQLAGILLREGIKLVQFTAGSAHLEGVQQISAPSFRHASAVLARARAAVLPEGGLHHAAAALGIKAVVIFGGYISPKQTGYALHRNLFTGGEPCGMRVPCEHCTMAMRMIEPEAVAQETLAIIRGGA